MSIPNHTSKERLTMTNPNYNVQWYADGTDGGLRLTFPNGYSLSIIPHFYNKDMLETAVLVGDEFSDPENQVSYCFPSELGDLINKVRDLPARTGCFTLAPNEKIQG
jgi:hypothetical protein